MPASLVAVRWASSKYAGTVITAWVTVSPRRPRRRAWLHQCASRNFLGVLLAIDVIALPVFAHVALHRPEGSVWVRNGLTLGYFTDENLPAFENATTDGVVRAPSEF